MTTLTAEQRLTRATVWLMGEANYAAFSGIYLMGSTSVVEDLPTAGTNGRDEFYGRAFVDGLEDAEIRALKLHETWHKAGRHLSIWKYLCDQDKQVANMAMDYVINLFIRDSDPEGKDVRLPAMGLLDEKYRGKDVGEVFDLLMQDKKDGKGVFGGKGGQPLDEHDWDGASELTEQEQKELSEQIDQALRQGALMASKRGGNVPYAFGELLAPQIKWEDQLRDFITASCSGRDIPSYRKPNKRYMDSPIVMPSMVAESVGRVVVAVDMSGSTTDAMRNTFLTETCSLCELVKPEAVDLLYWGDSIVGHETYDENSYAGLVTSTKPRSSGGTVPQCIVDYIKEKGIRAECIIILTDGDVYDWGTGWTVPTLWAITDKRNVSPIGKSIYVNVKH